MDNEDDISDLKQQERHDKKRAKNDALDDRDPDKEFFDDEEDEDA